MPKKRGKKKRSRPKSKRTASKDESPVWTRRAATATIAAAAVSIATDLKEWLPERNAAAVIPAALPIAVKTGLIDLSVGVEFEAQVEIVPAAIDGAGDVAGALSVA